MSFARYVQGGFDGGSFLPATAGEVPAPQEPHLNFDIDDVEFVEEAPVDPPATTSLKSKNAHSSDPKKKKKKWNKSGKLSVKDFELDEGDKQVLGPGKGKGRECLKRLLGYNPDVEKQVYSLTSSGESGSVIGGLSGDLHFTSASLRSSDYPPLSDVEGPFVPEFAKVQYKSMLNSEEERDDYLRHVMVPGRIWELSMMTNGVFQDFSHESVIQNMCAQMEHIRRFELAEEDKLRLLRENKKLRNKLLKLKSIEGEVSEYRGEALNKLHEQVTIKERAWEVAEHEVKVVRDDLEVISKERDEWKRKYEMEAVEASTLRSQNEPLKVSIKKLSEEVARGKEDRKRLISEAFPGAVLKLHKSYEFAREMGTIQSRAVSLGGHLMLGRVKAKYPKMDITRMEGYNPNAFEELKVFGAEFEEKNYPFIARLASSSDLFVDDWLKVEPEPFPEEDAP